jgi:hypothetical protein
MITDRAPLLPVLAFGLLLVLLGWLAVLGATLRLSNSAQEVFIPFPPAALLAHLPDAALTGLSPVSLTLRSDTPGLPARAYAAGAWLVLPAGLQACIPQALRRPI